MQNKWNLKNTYVRSNYINLTEAVNKATNVRRAVSRDDSVCQVKGQLRGQLAICRRALAAEPTGKVSYVQRILRLSARTHQGRYPGTRQITYAKAYRNPDQTGSPEESKWPVSRSGLANQATNTAVGCYWLRFLQGFRYLRLSVAAPLIAVSDCWGEGAQCLGLSWRTGDWTSYQC